jgi:hypothetical protein
MPIELTISRGVDSASADARGVSAGDCGGTTDAEGASDDGATTGEGDSPVTDAEVEGLRPLQPPDVIVNRAKRKAVRGLASLVILPAA